jgi:UDP-4-amino-4,6-dideoxy-N-acetyl-beta-L-altrosamine N-acetyltransferase
VNLILKNFIFLNNKEQNNILEIRNSDEVRINMKVKDIISLNNHLSWIKNLQNDKNNIYYAIILNNIIIGAIYINNIQFDEKTSWGIYLQNKTNPLISAITTYLFLDKIFNEIDVKILKLEVAKDNISAYKFDLSFGFEEYDTINNYIQMSINNIKWNNHKNIGYMKVLEKKIKKIEYKFI